MPTADGQLAAAPMRQPACCAARDRRHRALADATLLRVLMLFASIFPDRRAPSGARCGEASRQRRMAALRQR